MSNVRNLVMEIIFMKSLNVLLVTALIAPVLLLAGCCGGKDGCEKTYDKCGAEYSMKDGTPAPK